MKNTLLSLFALTAALSVQPAMAQYALDLFKSKPCAACHSIDTKLVGPALKDVAAKNAGVAAGWKNQLHQQLDRGALAGAIRAEEAKHLARFHLHAQPMQGWIGPRPPEPDEEILGQVVGLDRGSHLLLGFARDLLEFPRNRGVEKLGSQPWQPHAVHEKGWRS